MRRLKKNGRRKAHQIGQLLNHDPLEALVGEDERENVIKTSAREGLEVAYRQAVVRHQTLLHNRADGPLLLLQRRVRIVDLILDVVAEGGDESLGGAAHSVGVNIGRLLSHI